MKLRKMEFGGFRTFAEPTTFHFGSETGLYFLEGGRNEVDPSLGSNGVGKSTVWSALCWVLFGKTADGLKAGDLKSWQSEKKGYYGKVWIGKHLVERTWRPNKLTFDGEVVEQKRLEELLGLHFDTFVSAVVLAQGGNMFLDLTPARKLSLFTSILGLDKWIDYSARAKATADLIQADMILLANNISKLEGKLDGLGIEDLQQKEETWRADNTREIKRVTAQIGESVRDRDLFGERVRKVQAAVKQFKKEHEEAVELVERDKERYDKAVKKYNKTAITAENLRDRIAEDEEHLQQVKKGKGTCKHCGQRVNKGKLKQHVQALNEELDARRVELAIHEADEERLEDRKYRVAEDLETSKKESGRLRRTLEGYQEDAAKIEKDFAIIDSSVKSKKGRRRELKNADNPFTDLVAERKAEEERLEAKLEAKEKRHGTMQKRHNNVAYWVAGFREVRLYLIEEALAQLEVETNKALADLGFSTDWRMTYSIDKRTKAGTTVTGFNVAVRSPHTDGNVPFAAWSGGEKQRLKIAGSIGFIALMSDRTGIDLGIEVYDEPTQHLSPQGIDSLLETLRQRALATNKRIWLVDHHTLDYGDFAGRAVIHKKAEGSSIWQS